MSVALVVLLRPTEPEKVPVYMDLPGPTDANAEAKKANKAKAPPRNKPSAKTPEMKTEPAPTKTDAVATGPTPTQPAVVTGPTPKDTRKTTGTSPTPAVDPNTPLPTIDQLPDAEEKQDKPAETKPDESASKGAEADDDPDAPDQ